MKTEGKEICTIKKNIYECVRKLDVYLHAFLKSALD